MANPTDHPINPKYMTYSNNLHLSLDILSISSHLEDTRQCIHLSVTYLAEKYMPPHPLQLGMTLAPPSLGHTDNLVDTSNKYWPITGPGSWGTLIKPKG